MASDDTYLIDSHCHLHDRECFPDDSGENSPAEIIKDARKNNVRQMVVIGTSHEDSLAAQTFAATHGDVFWAYGIHPEYATTARSLSSGSSIIAGPGGGSAEPVGDGPVTTGAVDRYPQNGNFRDEKLLAIGEVGLDYHYAPYDRSAQISLLEEMLALAKKHDLPLIFHVREAFDDFFPVVENQHIKNAVVHSFSDSKENLERVLNHDFYVGVGGLATFAPIPLPPLERILLETDAPYLTPAPFRGKINKSGYIKVIAEYLSTKLGVPSEEIARETTKNVQTLFHIPRPVVRPA